MNVYEHYLITEKKIHYFVALLIDQQKEIITDRIIV